MPSLDSDVAIVGAGVVGCAVALELARRGASVAIFEAEPALGLGASGTNSGILHTGFDSPAGELETEMILRSAALRDAVLEALGVPVVRCGAELRPRDVGERRAVAALAANAKRNRVEVLEDGSLTVPGEAITDPIAYTVALAGAAERQGAEVRRGRRVVSLMRVGGEWVLGTDDGASVRTRLVVNCAGLHADDIARLAGDDSFEIYPRKGEFLVFDPPGGKRLERILLPVPTKRTKGVLVFPTVDGKVAAGPTAVDREDKGDWSVRPEAADEILSKATAMLPALEGAEPIAAYAGLRPAGRGVNYLIAASDVCPGLVNVAAIRSTGLTASLGIAERVTSIVGELGIQMGAPRPLDRVPHPQGMDGPWWRRVAKHRGLA